MDPEIKTILQENLRISHENNEMLINIVKAQRQQKIYRIVYWVLIIVVTIASFYFIEPYLGSIMNLYSGGAGDTSNISSVSDALKNLSNNQQSVQDLLK